MDSSGLDDLELTQPQNPMLGSQQGAVIGGGRTKALLDTIAYAEGTGASYGTIYGGAVVPELEAGDLTVAEVLKMQKTGKVRGRDAGYKKDGYNSDATGRYQFMSYVLEEEVRKQKIDKSEKFTPALQDKLILGRISRVRGVTPEMIESEGLSNNVIDRLAPEFASFPNLMGPDAKGNVGTNTSYYGQGGKSAEQLKSNYDANLASQPKPVLQSPQSSASPSGNAAPAALAQAAAGLQKQRIDTSRYGRNGCVYAVNEVYKRAGQHHLGNCCLCSTADSS